MTCNIDARGRRIRGISGTICLIAGIALLIAALLRTEFLWQFLIAGIVIAACGAFQIFESRKGWCAFRAMGLKTPW